MKKKQRSVAPHTYPHPHLGFLGRTREVEQPLALGSLWSCGVVTQGHKTGVWLWVCHEGLELPSTGQRSVPLFTCLAAHLTLSTQSHPHGPAVDRVNSAVR